MKQYFLLMYAVAVISFTVSGKTAFAIGGSIGHGDISVYKHGELVQRIHGTGPVEDGALLVCNGKCTIKSVGVSLVPASGTQIAVSNMKDTYNLFVNEGEVDFLLSSNKRKIAFYSKDGKYTTGEPVVLDEPYSTIKGRFSVSKDGEIDISIIEGRMLFETDTGIAAVDAGNTITTSINPPTGSASVPAAGSASVTSFMTTEVMAAAGFAATTVGLGVVAEETSSGSAPVSSAPVTPPSSTDDDDDDDSDSDSSASPST